MLAISRTPQLTFVHSKNTRTNRIAIRASATHRRGSRRLFQLASVFIAMLGLGLAWAPSARTQDRQPEPVHLAVTSAESAEMTVDLGDLTDSAKFPFSSTGKWKGYLEFLGKPGTERSLGQPDLFLPFLQDANDMTFLNIRGQLQFDNTDVHEYNIGLGHRHMFQEWIIGGYGYFDHRNTQFNNAYNQFTGGLEAMSVDWGFRVNGYLPENKIETITSGTDVSVIRPDDQIKVQIDGIVQEKALPGLDGEVGYLLPIPWKAYTAVFDETRVYAGGYHFLGEDQFESVTGPRGRVEWRAYDLPVLGPGSRFMMGVEAQWDEPRGSQAFGLASLRIPFDVFSDKSTRKQLAGLDRRMLQPVIRDVDIVTSEHNVPTEIVPLLNQAGRAYVKAVDVELADDPDPESTLRTELDANDEKEPTVFFPITGGQEIELNGELSLHEHQTLAGANFVGIYESARLGRRSIAYNPGGATTGLRADSAMTTMIAMEADSEVNGMTLDANATATNGLLINTTGTRWLAHSTGTNAEQSVVRAAGAGAEFRIDKSRITGSNNISAADAGVLAEGGATIYIRNSEVADNEGSGIEAVGTGSTIIANNLVVENNSLTVVDDYGAGVFAHVRGTIDIRDSEVKGNKGDGLEANDGTLIVHKVEVTNNKKDGVFLNDGTATITNSVVSNHDFGHGLTVGENSTLNADNVDIFDNLDGVQVLVLGTSSFSITNSRIYENRQHGVFVWAAGRWGEYLYIGQCADN